MRSMGGQPEKLAGPGDRLHRHISRRTVNSCRQCVQVRALEVRQSGDGPCVVGNRAVKVALVVPGTGPIEITAAGLRVDRNQRIGVRDDTIVLAQFGQGITAIAVR